jgi:hypothetical protein
MEPPLEPKRIAQKEWAKIFKGAQELQQLYRNRPALAARASRESWLFANGSAAVAGEADLTAPMQLTELESYAAPIEGNRYLYAVWMHVIIGS